MAVNASTYNGCTPLHIASGHGNIALVAYLLSVGADPELVTDEGDTALDLAGSEQVCSCSLPHYCLGNYVMTLLPCISVGYCYYGFVPFPSQVTTLLTKAAALKWLY